MTTALCETRYDRAVLKLHKAEAYLVDMIRLYGELDQRTIDAAQDRDAARNARIEALRDADDLSVQERERVDYWRANQGRASFNEARRTREVPNVDRFASEAEKIRARREKTAARVRKLRAKKAAESAE